MEETKKIRKIFRVILVYIAFGILFYSFYCQERDE